jgi:hypothetical protein
MLGRDGTDMHPFEYQTKLAAGRIVSLYALHVGRTYAGVMAGTPDSKYNAQVIERARRQMIPLWSDRPTYVIPPMLRMVTEAARTRALATDDVPLVANLRAPLGSLVRLEARSHLLGLLRLWDPLLVPTVGFEPTRLAALAPQASVSTNSTTSALSGSRALPGRYLGAGAGAGVVGGAEAGGGVTGKGAGAPVARLPFSAASSRIVFS